MNKLLVGILVTGAAVAAGVVVAKMLNKKDDVCDYDDDSFDYPDPYDTDESIDFEINDTTAEAAEEIAEAVEEAVDEVEEAAEAVEEAIEDELD